MTNPATRRARKAIRDGKRGQEFVAEKLRAIWPEVKSLWTAGRGSKQKDILDGSTPYTFEVKKRGGINPWSAFLEESLEQATGYAAVRHDPSIPLVVLVNSPGPGKKQEGRAYLDFDCWLEREQYIKKLEGDADRLAKADPIETEIEDALAGELGGVDRAQTWITIEDLKEYYAAKAAYLKTRGD